MFGEHLNQPRKEGLMVKEGFIEEKMLSWILGDEGKPVISKRRGPGRTCVQLTAIFAFLGFTLSSVKVYDPLTPFIIPGDQV